MVHAVTAFNDLRASGVLEFNRHMRRAEPRVMIKGTLDTGRRCVVGFGWL